MTITITGDFSHHVKPHYLQTLCLLFFPGLNFSLKSDNGDSLIIDIAPAGEHGEARISLTLRFNGRTEAECKNIGFTEGAGKHEPGNLSLAAGRAFYAAASRMSGIYPEWGIITGIRPAALAGAVYKRLKDKEAVINFFRNEYLTVEPKARLAIETYLNGERAIGTVSRGANPGDASLYISIPFCPTRCRYCSFISAAAPKMFAKLPEYVDRLINELKLIAGIVNRNKLRIAAIYIGGGTPAVLPLPLAERLLSAAAKLFHTENLLEYTFEAGRPDILTREMLSVIKKYGVTRLCVNPQTMKDQTLSLIGRGHTSADFLSAYTLARETGFDHINTDVIAGLPEESADDMLDTVERLIGLNPESITVHTMCVKKSAPQKTEAGKNPEFQAVSSELFLPFAPEAGAALGGMYKKLAENDYLPYYMYKQKYTVGNYENVGFSKAGSECLYNILMMDERQSIFGAGAGAVTKLVKTTGGSQKIERIGNPKYPHEYFSGGYIWDKPENIKLINEFFGG